MASLQVSIQEYRKQLARGAIQVAYRDLMDYIMSLRTYFQNQYPTYAVPGSIYYGYMDMTYFAIVPPSLKERKLKIAIVFLHEACRFEVWLAGTNKQVQVKYWNLFKESNWDKYKVVAPAKGVDSIIVHVLADNPDFGDLETLTRQIETVTLQFIQDVEGFLLNQEE